MKLTKLIARVLAPVLMFVGLSIAPASAVVGTAMTLTYDLSKISPSLTVGLPFYGAVSATINWGDGTTNTNATYGAVFSHTYATSGIYTISISGTMQHFGYDNIVNHPSCSVGGAVQCPGIAALTAVTSWGSIPFTSLNYAFAKAINLTDVPADFPSTVTKTTGMFYQASKINDSDISGWSMGNVTNMSAMFAGTDLFNQPLNSWDVSKVTTFEQMFAYTKVFNQPLNSWDTSSATVMSTMFFSAEAFNQNISNWNTSKVTLMVSMFQGQVYRNPFNNGGQPLAPNGVHWDTSLVTKMDAMFSYSSFTQDVSTWKTSSLQSASNMFYSNSTYNVDVSAWDISKLQGPAVNKQYYTLASMFYGTAFSTTNYDKLLNSWVDQDHTAGQTNGVYFGAQQTKYSCAGLYAREKLRSTYNWTFVDNGPTTACTLYVVPDAIRVTEGDPVPTYTFKYYADAAHTQELTAPLVTSAPTCSSDYAAEMVIADSARTITCSGGDAGSAFVYDFSATAQVRIGGPIVTLYVVPDNQNITEGDGGSCVKLLYVHVAHRERIRTDGYADSRNSSYLYVDLRHHNDECGHAIGQHHVQRRFRS